MDSVASVPVGMGLRFGLHFLIGQTTTTTFPILIGIWEGLCINHLISIHPESYDPYLAFSLRVIVDVLIAESFIAPFITLLWSILTVLIAAVLGPSHGHDTRRVRERTQHASLKRSSQTSRDLDRTEPRRTTHTRVQIVSPSVHAPSTAPPKSLPTYNTPPQVETKSSRPEGKPSLPAILTELPSRRSPSEPPSPPSTFLEGFTEIERPETPALIESHLPTPPSTSYFEAGDDSDSTVYRRGRLSTVPEESTPEDTLLREVSPSIVLETHVEEAVLPIPPPPPVVLNPRLPPLFPQASASVSQRRSSSPKTDSDELLTPQREDTHLAMSEDELQTPITTDYPLPPSDLPLAQHFPVSPSLQSHLALAVPFPLLLHPERPGDEAAVIRRTASSEHSPGNPLSNTHNLQILDEVDHILAEEIEESTSIIEGNTAPIPVPPPNEEMSQAQPQDYSPTTVASDITDADAIRVKQRAENLRQQAWEERTRADALRHQLRQAKSRRDVRQTFLLTGEIEELEIRVKKLHSSAERRYFQSANMQARTAGVQTVDLHGLLVHEAIPRLEAEFRDVLKNGGSEIDVIVGRGKHSKQGIPKLKPAIQRAMEESGMVCTPDKKNMGLLHLRCPL